MFFRSFVPASIRPGLLRCGRLTKGQLYGKTCCSDRCSSFIFAAAPFCVFRMFFSIRVLPVYALPSGLDTASAVHSSSLLSFFGFGTVITLTFTC